MSSPAVNQLGNLDQEIETILTSFDTSYAWNYGSVKEGLRDLYEKAKREQWNATTQLAWDTDVDPESEIVPAPLNPLTGYGPFDRLNDQERGRFRHAQMSNQLSQFLHGEQGALDRGLAARGLRAVDRREILRRRRRRWTRHDTSRSSAQLPQREARVGVARSIPISEGAARRDDHGQSLGLQVSGDADPDRGPRHGGLRQSVAKLAQEPLLKELLRYVMKDESRHVAFGVLALRDYYQDLSPGEMKDREDFIIYACELMRDRLVGSDIARAMDWDEEEVRQEVLRSEAGQLFRQMLFMRIVPNLKKLGLITPRVREAFVRLNIIQFEDLDPEAQDRELGLA